MNFMVVFNWFWRIIISSGFLSAFAQESDIAVEELTDSTTTITWTPADASSIIVQADDGYQIQVDVTQFDLDGEKEDYVLVKSLSDDGEEHDPLMFTYMVSAKPSYLYNNHRVQAEYVVGSTESNNNHNNTFHIQFTRVGEATTTTPEPESTTTTEAMPTPSPEESNTYTVYLEGLPAEQFDEPKTEKLRNAIAQMAKDYCYEQGCPLNGTITSTNVKIELLEQCPVIWENYKNCINLTFALPIVKMDDYNDDEPWSGYQLKTAHLKVMWSRYADNYLNNINLNQYNIPDISRMTTTRLIVICLVIVALVLLILLLKHINAKIQKKRRKMSDTFSIINQQSNRNSRLSLTPHYLQELPPLFSNDFPLYAEQVHHKPFSDFNPEFAEKPDPFIPSSASNKLNISGDGPDEIEEAEA